MYGVTPRDSGLNLTIQKLSYNCNFNFMYFNGVKMTT